MSCLKALDPENRGAVVKKIKELSEEAQFICTTFRKEFVVDADRIFGVSYRNLVRAAYSLINIFYTLM